VLFYRAALPLSTKTLNYVAGVIRRHRKALGSRRKLGVRVAAGPVHDKKAGWTWGVLDELQAAGMIVLADKGYQSAAHAKVPCKGKNKLRSQKDANKARAQLRAPGERANAQLKNWHILRKLCCCPWRAGQLAKAIHALEIHAA
jgi:hypothetical protein